MSVSAAEHFFVPGTENYKNQMKYGKEVFAELQESQENRMQFGGVHHDITSLLL